MASHGFPVKPFDEALAATHELRRRYDAPLEFLIDTLEAPRGFWGHAIGHRSHAIDDLSSPEDDIGPTIDCHVP